MPIQKRPISEMLVCSRCDKRDVNTPPRIVDNVLIAAGHTGTARIMRCESCAGADGFATLCRDCCPSGHGTRFAS